MIRRTSSFHRKNHGGALGSQESENRDSNLLQAWDALVEGGRIQDDPSQRNAVECLAELQQIISDADIRTESGEDEEPEPSGMHCLRKMSHA